MLRSKKKVIELKEIVGERLFLLPRKMANDIDIVTGQPCLFIGINGKATYIPVEVKTHISYPVFCILKDLGIPYETYDEGGIYE